MKKIIALLAIVAMSFSSKAAYVNIINNTNIPISGTFGHCWSEGIGGTAFIGGALLTIPAFGGSLSYTSVGDFMGAAMGSTAPSLPASATLYGWYFSGPGCISFGMQNTSYMQRACGMFGGMITGYTVTATVIMGVGTTIVIGMY